MQIEIEKMSSAKGEGKININININITIKSITRRERQKEKKKGSGDEKLHNSIGGGSLLIPFRSHVNDVSTGTDRTPDDCLCCFVF